jgi:3-hydroxyacyl-CoA dehydrogenase/enoyl-CoA hydratase/3-hydroxybutyryl-CoA epimerase
VFEQRDLKAAVTREAEPMLAEGGVFASNTSTLPISALAEASARPSVSSACIFSRRFTR